MIVVDGVQWVPVMEWYFKDGHYPNWAGWGIWTIVNGLLEGKTEEVGASAVYFFPYTHKPDFILETRFMFISGLDTAAPEAQLLTRDSAAVKDESGMVVFHKDAVHPSMVWIRHRVNYEDLIYLGVDAKRIIEYGVWYTVRFVIYKGRIKAFLNDSKVYDSEESYPVGEVYREPHLALFNGTVRWEYVKIYGPAPPALGRAAALITIIVVIITVGLRIVFKRWWWRWPRR